ncbi:hypothetical protein HRbin36_01118 [bacterium HR36]|nr:hypothetical protein HRbin36_01118 [bacterium HR36]
MLRTCQVISSLISGTLLAWTGCQPRYAIPPRWIGAQTAHPSYVPIVNQTASLPDRVPPTGQLTKGSCQRWKVLGEDKNPPRVAATQAPALLSPPGTPHQPLPINLPTALQLAGVNPLDISLPVQRLEASQAPLDHASVFWLTALMLGGDYFRHDGRIQDVAGHLFDTCNQPLMLGVSPGMIFSVADAIYASLVARQVVAARENEIQLARNDALLAAAEACFAIQQARGEVLGLAGTLQLTQELAQRVEKLAAEGLVPSLERSRVASDLARRRQALERAYERWRLASAELNRLSRLDSMTVVTPLEPPLSAHCVARRPA